MSIIVVSSVLEQSLTVASSDILEVTDGGSVNATTLFRASLLLG